MTVLGRRSDTDGVRGMRCGHLGVGSRPFTSAGEAPLRVRVDPEGPGLPSKEFPALCLVLGPGRRTGSPCRHHRMSPPLGIVPSHDSATPLPAAQTETSGHVCSVVTLWSPACSRCARHCGPQRFAVCRWRDDIRQVAQLQSSHLSWIQAWGLQELGCV